MLLCHRADLLALVGAALLAAAAFPALRTAAIVGALASKLAFLALWGTTADAAPPLRQIAVADAVAVPLLLLAWWFDRA